MPKQKIVRSKSLLPIPEHNPFLYALLNSPAYGAHLPNAGRFLDLGCGYGSDAVYMAQHGYVVDAVEFDDALVQRLLKVLAERHVSNCTVYPMSILDFRWVRGDRYHAVQLWDILSELPAKDIESITSLAWHAVRPGGFILVHVLSAERDEQRKVGKNTFYVRDLEHYFPKSINRSILTLTGEERHLLGKKVPMHEYITFIAQKPLR